MTIRNPFAELWDSDILDSLWRIFSSPYATMALLLTLALFVLAGTLLPQRPAQTLTDPLAESVWTASLRARFGDLAEWMLRLRFVNLYSSLWLRGVLGLLAFNIALATANLIQVRKPGSDGELDVPKRTTVAPLLVFVGVLLILGGSLISERLAWWEDSVSLRPGQVRPVGHGTGLAFRAESIEPYYDRASGQVLGGRTALSFLRAAGPVGQDVLYDQTPSLYGRLLFYQISTEPVLLVQAEDAAGRGLSLQTPETGATQLNEVTLRFRDAVRPPGQRSPNGEEASRFIVVLGVPGEPSALQFEQKGNERYVLIPGRDLSLRLLFAAPEPGEATPRFQVEAFRGAEATPFLQTLFTAQKVVDIDGDRYTFLPQRYAVIKFGQDYALVPILLGGLLVLVGMVLSAWGAARKLGLDPGQNSVRSGVEDGTSAQPVPRPFWRIKLWSIAACVALTALLLAVTRNWSIARMATAIPSLPRAWWVFNYLVWVVACSILLHAGIRSLARLATRRWVEGRYGARPGSRAILGLPFLTLLLLLGALSGIYTRGIYWEWTASESRLLVAWLWYVMLWCANVLLGWRGRRIEVLSLAGLVVTASMLLMPGR